MKLLVCFFSCAMCCAVWSQDPEPLSQADSLKRDQELRVFLKRLHHAAANRDTTELFPLIDEQVGSEPLWMDGIWTGGKRDFIRFWKLENPRDSSVLWQLLSDISQMNGVYGMQMNSYVLPLYDPKFESDDWFVMADSVAVYAQPNVNSPIVRWLPKGTMVAQNYLRSLPKNWMRCPKKNPDPFGNQEPVEWIQTRAIYMSGWVIGMRYKHGKWFLSGTSGFDYLHPRFW